MSDWLASMWWFLPTAGVLLHVVTILYILYRETDDVSERTFWLLTVTLLPMAGIVLFLFFGITRIRPVRRMSRQHDDFEREEPRRGWLGEGISVIDREVARFRSPAAVREQEPHRVFEQLFPASLLLEGNGGEILRNGTEAYPVIWDKGLEPPLLPVTVSTVPEGRRPSPPRNTRVWEM